MCNNYRLHVPANQLAAPFRDAGRSINFPEGQPNLEQTDYRIGDRAPIVTLGADALQLAMTTWAWTGAGWKAGVQLPIGRTVLREIEQVPDPCRWLL